FEQIVNRIRGLAGMIRQFPATIASLRQGQVLAASGSSPIYPDADVSTFPRILAFIPRGFATAVLAPFPWESRDGASTGAFRRFSTFEMLLVYALLPFSVLAIVRERRRGEYWLLAL